MSYSLRGALTCTILLSATASAAPRPSATAFVRSERKRLVAPQPGNWSADQISKARSVGETKAARAKALDAVTAARAKYFEAFKACVRGFKEARAAGAAACDLAKFDAVRDKYLSARKAFVEANEGLRAALVRQQIDGNARRQARAQLLQKASILSGNALNAVTEQVKKVLSEAEVSKLLAGAGSSGAKADATAIGKAALDKVAFAVAPTVRSAIGAATRELAEIRGRAILATKMRVDLVVRDRRVVTAAQAFASEIAKKVATAIEAEFLGHLKTWVDDAVRGLVRVAVARATKGAVNGSNGSREEVTKETARLRKEEGAARDDENNAIAAIVAADADARRADESESKASVQVAEEATKVDNPEGAAATSASSSGGSTP